MLPGIQRGIGEPMTRDLPEVRFASADDEADVAVLIVTYNSAAQIDGLLDSLRREGRDTRLRVVIADNDSSDGTLAAARMHRDVIVVPTGGNLGYAGGINVAAAHAGRVGALLILNPDLRVRPGAVHALRRCLQDEPAAGIVAPMILDDDGSVSVSLFNEPGTLRALADAVLGPLWKSRPAALSEWVRGRGSYGRRRRVAWVSGAALLVSSEAAERVGEWDERFFLYSEETDYCRRVRDAGFTVAFEPAARVEHSGAGSGSSPALDALLSVNRIRYMLKHAPRQAGLYRRVALLGSRLRRHRSPIHGSVERVLRDPTGWGALPRASWRGTGGPPVASVIVPAHDEAAVIERTLEEFAAAAAAGSLDVHVVCNGCRDDTADRARAFPGVRVSVLDLASKPAAVNEGLRTAAAWPRIIVDADVDFPSAAIPSLVRALSHPDARAGRPPFDYDLLGSSRFVRGYYRARQRVPALAGGLWGAGAYALSPAGQERVAPLPMVTADDYYVDRAFAPREKTFPPAPPVTVHAPRTLRALLRVLTRSRRGVTALGDDAGRQTLFAIVRTVRGPSTLADAVIFAVLTACARVASRRAPDGGRWERDESSRGAPRPRAGA